MFEPRPWTAGLEAHGAPSLPSARPSTGLPSSTLGLRTCELWPSPVDLAASRRRPSDLLPSPSTFGPSTFEMRFKWFGSTRIGNESQAIESFSLGIESNGSPIRIESQSTRIRIKPNWSWAFAGIRARFHLAFVGIRRHSWHSRAWIALGCVEHVGVYGVLALVARLQNPREHPLYKVLKGLMNSRGGMSYSAQRRLATVEGAWRRRGERGQAHKDAAHKAELLRMLRESSAHTGFSGSAQTGFL